MGSLLLQSLTKHFDRVIAVNGVSVEIPDGHLVTLLGPSGCGKSTTLYLIAGLESPTAGEIFLDGQRITHLAPNERGMAIVFQNYALYPHMSVFDNLAFALRLQKRPSREIEGRVHEVAEGLQIRHLLERRPSQLSGGQQQRVALGRALVKQPRVFLFDEPLSNVDAALRTQLRGEIRKLHLQLGATSVFVTHDQEEAMVLSDSVAVMRDGSVMQYSSARDVYRRPNSLYVATFVGKPRMGLISGTLAEREGRPELVAGDTRLPLPWRPTLEPNARMTVGVRAEDVRLAPGATGTNGPTLSAEVSLIEALGPDTFVELTAAGCVLTARVEAETPLRIGDRVQAHLSAARLHLFETTSGRRVDWAEGQGRAAES